MQLDVYQLLHVEFARAYHFRAFWASGFWVDLSGLWTGHRAAISKERWVNLKNGMYIYFSL